MSPVWPVVAATGHRPQHLSPAEQQWVRAELARITVKLRDRHGMTTGCTGMAIGTDLWWAADLVTAQVKVWAHIPFPQQPDKWQPADRAEWLRIRKAADQVTWYGDAYSVALLHDRNRGMVNAAQAVVAVWNGKTSGGTYQCLRYADLQDRPVIHVNPTRRTVTFRQSMGLVAR